MAQKQADLLYKQTIPFKQTPASFSTCLKKMLSMCEIFYISCIFDPSCYKLAFPMLTWAGRVGIEIANINSTSRPRIGNSSSAAGNSQAINKMQLKLELATQSSSLSWPVDNNNLKSTLPEVNSSAPIKHPVHNDRIYDPFPQREGITKGPTWVPKLGRY